MDRFGSIYHELRTYALIHELDNNRTGTDKLADCLAQCARSGGYSAIHIKAEATNNYWLPFFCQLRQSCHLSTWPFIIYIIEFMNGEIDNHRQGESAYNLTSYV